MSSQWYDRWLPIGFRFNSPAPSVTWLDVGPKKISEPFYGQTIRNARSAPSTSERTTGIEKLIQIADSFPSIDPAGIIFHVSRCGSTLLTNAFKAGGECTTLSEASVIESLVRENTFQGVAIGIEGVDNIRGRLLRAVVSLYTACFGLPVVIKAHTTDILLISRLRVTWPSVPFIVNVRNPVEVMASNLAAPADWLRSIIAPYGEENVFGFTGPETRQMTMEEYCARGLGRFLEAANAQLDEQCWVLDYKHMNLENIYKAAQLINLEMPQTHAAQIASAFQTYSKDPAGTRTYVEDGDWKQRTAPPSVHSLAAQWTMGPYQKLLETSTFSI
jgi:hypothetical protein